jgi:ribosomal protein L10
MKLDQKQTITEELRGHLTSAEVVYLTDFTGLTVEAIGSSSERPVPSTVS